VSLKAIQISHLYRAVSDILESPSTVDTYYSILKKLEAIIIEDDALRSDASLIQSLMIEDLVHTFIKKKKNMKTLSSIDDDLLDMFRGLGVKSDLDDLQTMFRSMKVDF
jgi:hypothetical protein